MFNKKLAALVLALGFLLPGAARADAVISALGSTTTILPTDEIPWCQSCTLSTPATTATVSVFSTYLGSLTQTLTNKTLTSPALTSPTVTGSFTATGLVTSADLASVLTAGGPTGSASVAPIITYNAEGQLTAVSSATIAPTAAGLETNLTAAFTANFPPVNADCLVGNATPAWTVTTCPGSGLSGMTGGQLPVAATATTVASSIPYGLTGNSTIAETTSSGLLTPSILPLATGSAFGAVKTDEQTIHATSGVISVIAPDRTITSTTGDAFVVGDMGGQVNLGAGSTLFTVPAIGSGIWNAGATAILVNNSGAAITVTNTATVNGPCGGATYALPIGATCTYTSNGTTVDSAGLAGVVQPTLLGTGTTGTLKAPKQYYVCTGTCTVTPPVPAAGYEFCVMNDDNVSTVITLAALGSSAQYEKTNRTGYGTAGTGTYTSGGAVGDKICLLGLNSTHYLVPNTFIGTWTAN